MQSVIEITSPLPKDKIKHLNSETEKAEQKYKNVSWFHFACINGLYKLQAGDGR